MKKLIKHEPFHRLWQYSNKDVVQEMEIIRPAERQWSWRVGNLTGTRKTYIGAMFEAQTKLHPSFINDTSSIWAGAEDVEEQVIKAHVQVTFIYRSQLRKVMLVNDDGKIENILFFKDSKNITAQHFQKLLTGV
jgi:hypothetical protein